MQTQEVIQVCLALAKAGKKPSIALVKTKLSNKVKLATIVKGIQHFHVNQELGLNQESVEISHANETLAPETQSASTSCACEQKIAQLELAIASMSKQLKDLQIQVQALG